MRETIVVLALSISFAIVGYSFLRTAEADPGSRLWITSLAMAFLVVLVGLGWISSADVGDGLSKILFRFLPNIVGWGSSSTANTALLGIGLIAVAFLSYWFGPHSLHKINVLTGSARFISIDGEIIPAPGVGFVTRDVWKPGRGKDRVQAEIACLTKDRRSWLPEPRGEMMECGEPLEPTLIVNGIEVSGVDRDTTAGRRIHGGVASLRSHLADELPGRDVKDTLLIATWNIRDFGGGISRKRFGPRLEESLYYIAEIISHFDIVAVQEARSDTGPIKRLLDILGPDYDAIYGLVNPNPKHGRERLAFIFDKRKVRLGPVIASVVTDAIQYSRIPYVATFDVAGRRVTFCTVHMYFGGTGGEERARRIEEIKGLAKFLILTKRLEPEWEGPLIVLGDMNAPTASSDEIEALKEAGFYLDPDLAALPSNFTGTKTYDQIALLNEEEGFATGRVGVFDYFDDVFTEADEATYRAELGRAYLEDRDGTPASAEKRRQYYRQWATSQMSDHFVKWTEYRLTPQSNSQSEIR